MPAAAAALASCPRTSVTAIRLDEQSVGTSSVERHSTGFFDTFCLKSRANTRDLPFSYAVASRYGLAARTTIKQNVPPKITPPQFRRNPITAATIFPQSPTMLNLIRHL